MVWAEDVMAGRMGSAVCMSNAVGGDGFIAEVAFFFFGVRADGSNGGRAERGERRRQGIDGFEAEFGWGATLRQMDAMDKGDAKNDAKNDAKMMMKTGEKMMKIDEKTMKTDEKTIVMARGRWRWRDRWVIRWLLVGSMVMVVTTSGGFGAMSEWEVFKKSFELAQNDVEAAVDVAADDVAAGAAAGMMMGKVLRKADMYTVQTTGLGGGGCETKGNRDGFRDSGDGGGHGSDHGG